MPAPTVTPVVTGAAPNQLTSLESFTSQINEGFDALTPNVRKLNTEATRAPLPSDDETQGYAVGSRWQWQGMEWLLIDASAGRWILQGALTPEMFGAGTSPDDTAALQAWLDADGPNHAAGEREYTVSGPLTIPAGRKVSGVLRLATDQMTGTILSIGTDVTLGELHLRYTGALPTSAGVTIAAGFRAALVSLQSGVEMGNESVRIDNDGLDLGRFVSRNWTRPLVLGLGGAVATVGGKIDSVEIDTFTRALAVNHAYGWRIRSFVARGRSSTAAKQPGHNGILIAGASDWIIDEAHIDGAGEHAFRIGGSSYGGESCRWRIGKLTARNTGGCVFKLADHIALTQDWTVGSIHATGNLGGAPGRNSELLRLSYARNGYIGSAVARREGGTYSVSGGLHVADARNIHVGELDIADYLTEAVSAREQDSVVGGVIASGITVGYLRAVGSVGTLVSFATVTGTIDGAQIADGYFDTSGANLAASETGTVFTAPVEIGGYLKAGPEALSGSVAGFIIARLRRPNGSVTLGRGVAVGGDAAVNAQPFNADDVGAALWGGVHVTAQGVTAADGAMGAGISFSRPGSPGRRGAALVPYQDGAAAHNIGLMLRAGSSIASTNGLLNQWAFRSGGDLDFNNSNRGPVIRSPNGTRYRIVVSDVGAISAVAI